MAAFRGGLAAARAVLSGTFGLGGFRPAQVRVLGPLLAGRDVLAVLPTGAGKSLCYQVPALLAGGLTVVVTPLVSLMQEQTARLRARGVAAAGLNALQKAGRRREILSAVRDGTLRLLYCAPERLPSLARRLREWGREVSLLAIDEAHCVTEWGGEFRPAYRRLGECRYVLRNPVTIALTGSATAPARAEIIGVLRLDRPETIVTSFDRPNLRFLVERVRDDRERFQAIRTRAVAADGATLVYAPTRRLTELVTRALLRTGVPASAYHAGLAGRERRRVLRLFLSGERPVVVATTAFGMGIDRRDVRRVLHWGPAHSLEGYYQEAGRAGRDGAPADCVLFWRPRDFAYGTIAAPMRAYVEGRGCRRRALVAHFGERLERCGGCDRCGPGDRSAGG